MMKKVIAFAGFAVLSGVASSASATKTYHMSQVVYYNAPCTHNTLYDDTYVLDSRMRAANWQGRQYPTEWSWAYHWREACSSVYGSWGSDSSWSDNSAVSVFSGHGDSQVIGFGMAMDTCWLNVDNESRLGSMAGSQAAIAMYITCTTLSKNANDEPTGGRNQWLQQQLGFYGDPGNNADQYGGFFDDTSTKTNVDAWLDRLSGKPAIVLTYSNGYSNCWDVANSAKMKADIFNSPRGSGPSCEQGDPLYSWCMIWNY